MARSNPALAMQAHFAALPDPRVERSRLHDLMDIVAIALCAVICRAEGWEDIAKYGRAKHDWLKTFLRLPNGTPSHDTFRRAFCMLDPPAVQERFRRWIHAIA